MNERLLPPELVPPARRPVPATWVAQRRTHLVGELRPKRRRLRGPRRILLVPIGAILVAGAAWAAGVFSGGPVHDSSNVVCYQAASLHARHTKVDIRAMVSPNHGGSPRAACVPFFERGYFSVAARSGGAHARAVPALITCIGDGVVRVFPGRGPSVCRRLGERYISDTEYLHEIEYIDRAFLNASIALAEAGGGKLVEASEGVYIAGNVCAPSGEALRMVQARLRKHALGAFRVVVDPRVGANECLSVAVEGPHFDGRTITLSSSRIVAPHEDVDALTAPNRARRACRNPHPRTDQQIGAKIDCALERRAVFGGSSGPLCVTARRAKRKAERILRRAHLRRWQVRVEGGTADPGAASVWLVDHRLRLVVLRFTPLAFSPQCNEVREAQDQG